MNSVLLERIELATGARFFRRPLHTTFGSSVKLEALVTASEVLRASQAIATAVNDRDRIAAFESFRLGRLRSVANDRLVCSALQLIEQDPVSTRVGVLAAELGISCDRLCDQSHFIREFRAFTGEAPSRFFRAAQYC